MRTTLNLDDQLLKSARHRAVEEGVSLARVIESSLREFLLKSKKKHEPIRLVTAFGPGVKPGVDLGNGRSLLDIMDDPS
jgi:hypothetical protein